MKMVENRTFDEERALYGSDDIVVRKCRFDGPADGESALKESKNIKVEDCYWNLRYPFWHDSNLIVEDTELSELCRAPFWYSNHVIINSSQLNGTKALRECFEVKIKDCDIISDEFGWSVHDCIIEDTNIQSEYFMMRSTNLKFSNIHLKGKYSFQYIENALFENCIFDTKDAFWHAKNVTVRNCEVNGEYLGWYSENVIFDHCTIKGTQPLCYCKGLKLIDCVMEDADLSFEKSEVEATVISPVISIKNPSAGTIRVPMYGELIMDDPDAKCNIVTRKGN